MDVSNATTCSEPEGQAEDAKGSGLTSGADCLPACLALNPSPKTLNPRPKPTMGSGPNVHGCFGSPCLGVQGLRNFGCRDLVGAGHLARRVRRTKSSRLPLNPNLYNPYKP